MADPASDSTPRSAPHPGHNVFDTDTAGVLTLDITGASDAFYNADTVRAMTVALAEWTDAVVAETEARGGRFAAFTGDGLILWFPTPDAELMLMVTRAAGALWAERGVGLVVVRLAPHGPGAAVDLRGHGAGHVPLRPRDVGIGGDIDELVGGSGRGGGEGVLFSKRANSFSCLPNPTMSQIIKSELLKCGLQDSTRSIRPFPAFLYSGEEIHIDTS